VKLVFTVQPSATRSGGVMTPPVQVAAEDGAGNVVTSYTGTISLDLPPDHELGGTRSVDAVNGVATFTGLIVFGYADVQYVLKAYANGLADASSAPFLITK